MSARKSKDDLKRALAETDSIVQMARFLWIVPLPGSMTPEQLEALRLIDKHAPMGTSALARLAGVRPPTMSRMVGILVRQGLVRQRPDRIDRRTILLSLTARGRQVLHRANRLLIQRTKRALQGLSKEEAELLPRLASKLKVLLES